ncbi:MAG: S49 family peptidase [Labrys sp. (in: a-proteobacteria)]
MSLESDLLVDRRRLRRRLSLWRFIAFATVAIALVAVVAATLGADFLKAQTRHIARIKIEGFIGDQTENAKLIADIERSNAVAVIVVIDSPGGSTSGGEALYANLLQLSKVKPTVAQIDGLGASAAYMAAIATNHIVARRTALVGSIGVLIQFPNVAGLMNLVGVKLEEVKSSPLKAAPNGFEPSSPEALAALAAVVNDTYAWFKAIVKERRRLEDGPLATVTDGRIFTGQQALDLGLIDQIGSEAEALAYLKASHNIDPATPIRDWSVPRDLGNLGLMHMLAAGTLEALGAPQLAEALRSGEAARAGALDGLVSVWHPRIEN